MSTPLNKWGIPSSFTPTNDRQVVSLDEWQSPWTDALKSFQAQEADPNLGAGQRTNFNMMLVERLGGTPGIDHTNIGAIGDIYWNNALSAATNGAGNVNPDADKFFSDGKNFNFSDLVGETSGASYNMAAHNAGMKAIADPFNEAVNRQATAYGQMQGGNYFGGMTNEAYTQGSASDGYSAGQGGGNALGLGQSTPQGWAGVGQPTAAGPLGPTRQMTAGRVGGLGGLGGFNPESAWGGPFGGN